ncbi:Glycosyltransferase involved in cell wall bisynthesis [Bosea sp. OK403]|uniref:glycosyltransferase n=1 Tax=Bosea sp. OK403 TaxID=1855286 RepID=UPI0008E055F7|nr:glycosyltransferase [Bosea sp. OK403]SFI49217.1 Glycosyltransferase involved in cell wall bisynthesis [Bosea sp. OK403]
MRIACVHQGYELYGSDRSFAESVAALRAAYPLADIEVVLPRPGPILSLLEGKASRVSFEPIWVLRRQALLRLATSGLARLPRALMRAARRLRENDLVYINTSVVTDYTLAAHFFPNKALLHIHEIPEGAARTILRALARWSRAEIIFNSQATRAAFSLHPSTRTHVIYNGVTGPAAPEPVTYDGVRPLRVLMLGRISRIKGQEVLLEAVAALPPELRTRIELRLVGSAFESEERERALPALVAAMGLTGQVSVEPFVSDPSSLYRWADIVAVPSRRPESLGRVAIEAMAFGRPPVVSAIGGLTEVVRDGRSGWLVPPGDAAALSARLRTIIEDPMAWRGFAAAGRARYEALFSERAAMAAIGAVAGAKLFQPDGGSAIRATVHAKTVHTTMDAS